MARVTAKVTDRRKDWAEKVSTGLVCDHDVIVFEKLNTKGMVHARLSRQPLLPPREPARSAA
jgi:transposase